MAYNVMKTDEFPSRDPSREADAVFYRVACECGDKDHDASLILEYDKEKAKLIMTLYQAICVTEWQENWFWGAWRRVKFAAKMIFTGHLEAEGTLTITHREHIQSFMYALEEGRAKLRGKE